MRGKTGLLIGVMIMVGALVASACGGPAATPTAQPTVRPTATTQPTATAAPAQSTPTPTRVAPTATPSGPQPVYGGIVRRPYRTDPGHLDLQKARDGANWMTVPPLVNWLVSFSVSDGIQPDLASSWDVSQDGKTYTFKLNPNAKWQDGNPVTADDIVFNINRLAFSDELKGGPYRPTFLPLASVDKVDNLTVRLTLSRVSASFLPSLGQIGIAIYPKHMPIADFSKKTPEAVVGSGPFKLKEWVQNVRVTEVRNPTYFKKDSAGRQLPYLDTLELAIIPDVSAQYSAFRTGKLDMTTPLESTSLRGKEKSVTQDVPGSKVQIKNFNWVYLTFNAKVKPWDDVRVRKAFSLAISRQEFNQVAYEGLGTPYRALTTPGTGFAFTEDQIKSWPGYNPNTRAADLAEAKRLLQEAGVQGSSIAGKLPSRDVYAQTAEVIAAQYRAALGANWTIDSMDAARTLKVYADRSFDVLSGHYGSALPDPSAELAPFLLSSSGLNWGGFNDPTVDSRLNEIDATLDRAKRMQLSQSLEKEVLIDKVWFVITGSEPFAHAWLGRLQGYNGYTLNQEGPYLQLEKVWVSS